MHAYHDEGNVEEIEKHIFEAITTADPLINSNQCIVLIIYGEQYKIAFSRPVKDITWTSIEGAQLRLVYNILYFNYQIYGLTHEGELKSLELQILLRFFLASCGF